MEDGNLSVRHLIDYYKQMGKHDIKMYYKGPFDEVILSKMISHVRSGFSETKAGNKLFAIFLELAQNISFYSIEKNILEGVPDIGIGTVIIQEKDNTYTLIASNLVGSSQIDPLVSRLQEIKTLDQNGLRELKRKLRSELPDDGTEAKSGNIGLVQAALKADYPLGFEANKIDDTESLLTIYATVNK